MQRFVRLAALAVGVLGLVATSAPPSSATTTGNASFTGSAILGGPLGAPGTDPLGLPPIVPEQHCGLPLPQPLPTPGTVPQCHVNPGGHTRGIVAVTSTACADNLVNVNKGPSKPLTVTGVSCQFSNAAPLGAEGNHVHGYCGLSGGQVQITFTDSTGNTYTLDVHFVGTASVLTITGHWRKPSSGQTGLLTGEVNATPIPTVPPGNSCATNTATVFTLAGTVTMSPHV